MVSKGLDKPVMIENVFSEIRRVLKSNMVDEESLDAIIQAELGIDENESIEDLFHEAFGSIEDARERVDRLQRAGVSLLTPPCREVIVMGLAAKG